MDKLRQTEKSLTKEKNQTIRQNYGLSSGKTLQTDEQRYVNKAVKASDNRQIECQDENSKQLDKK